jgi:endonuclease/exonuclease/phosphatase family metal-dependent hydrolase
MTKRTVFAWILLLPWLAAERAPKATSTPEFLSFDELVTLSNTDVPAEALAEKLDRILRTPILSNHASDTGVRPHRPTVASVGPVLRAVSWNIERGLNFDLIRLAFTDPEKFKQVTRPSAANEAKIDEQLRILRDADVVVLNEVDLGMKRTDYRDVAKDLAQALDMNYVFAVEFVEVDRLDDLGLDQIQLEDPALTQQMREDLKPDPARYRGLHGSAILSRYPIQNARILRLPLCYDWYQAEKAAISKLESGKRLAANKLFLERIEREVRRGGRMAIIADVQIPDLPEGVATVVNVHLENRCKPGCRARQMDALLARIEEIENPVIVAGDLNTSGTNGTPTSIRREIFNRVKDYEFWVSQALRWGTPASLPLAVLTPVKYFKNYLDPTSTHLPVAAPNNEAILFRHVEKFRFIDHQAFDFRGDSEHNLHGKGRTLANSNQRARKGFEPTFALKRDFGGLVGRYKLDWFLIKPYTPRPRGEGMSYRFAPHFPVTMRELNNAVPDGISDHAPITVDLPLSLSTNHQY